jgi:repressor LexA
MKGLTERQREILDYIEAYIAQHHFSPSYRDIMRHFEFSSIASVSKHLKVLQRKGAIDSEKYSRRSLVPKTAIIETTDPSEVELPFIGHIMAGAPIEMFPRSQTLSIPKTFVNDPENTYILRARGESFNREMIADGDLLIVEARAEALAGETIVGAFDSSRTFIMQYYPEGNSVRLTSHSPNDTSIRYDELTILGVVTGLWRLYRT